MTPEAFTIGLIKKFFDKYGIKYQSTGNLSTWLFRYFNFRLKYVPIGRREVFVSAELKLKMAKHPAALELLEILENTRQGNDLNPYQSTGISDSDRHDDLYNDWGIHHLHLTSKLEKHRKSKYKYFVERSDYLVFVIFKNSAAYFIDVFRHSEKPLWGKKHLISVLQNNWESLIKPYESRNLWHPELEDGDIEILRSKGYSFGVNVNGKGYLMLGAGQSTAGNNMDANRLADNTCRWIHENRHSFEKDRTLFEDQLLLELDLERI